MDKVSGLEDRHSSTRHCETRSKVDNGSRETSIPHDPPDRGSQIRLKLPTRSIIDARISGTRCADIHRRIRCPYTSAFTNHVSESQYPILCSHLPLPKVPMPLPHNSPSKPAHPQSLKTNRQVTCTRIRRAQSHLQHTIIIVLRTAQSSARRSRARS